MDNTFAPNLFDETGRKTIDLSAVGNTPIVDTLGAGGVNLVFVNTASQLQFGLDLSAYAGVVDSLVVDQAFWVVNPAGGVRTLLGSYTIVPSAQTIQFFLEDTINSPDPLTALSSFYRFTAANASNGSFWRGSIYISAPSVDGVIAEFIINATKENKDQTASGELMVIYTYKRFF